MGVPECHHRHHPGRLLGAFHCIRPVVLQRQCLGISGSLRRAPPSYCHLASGGHPDHLQARHPNHPDVQGRLGCRARRTPSPCLTHDPTHRLLGLPRPVASGEGWIWRPIGSRPLSQRLRAGPLPPRLSTAQSGQDRLPVCGPIAHRPSRGFPYHAPRCRRRLLPLATAAGPRARVRLCGRDRRPQHGRSLVPTRWRVLGTLGAHCRAHDPAHAGQDCEPTLTSMNTRSRRGHPASRPSRSRS
ncbi:hypothetical protein BC828DRAFT_296084 [Blastocladiella britannica]|nr:hypothetical protein BC828DRAFT_296084 [Blastocladiella britannica]